MYDLEDLNEGIFDSTSVFNTDEIRSFIYILTPKKDNIINRFQSEKLGQLEIKWVNYLGDAGYLKVGPLKYTADNTNSFEIEVSQCRDQSMELELEEPQDMRFRVQNLSKSQMNLSIVLQERPDHASDLII